MHMISKKDLSDAEMDILTKSCSPTKVTISTSLIHCIASARNCEQVHTSVLNLIFHQTNVVGVGNLSK